MYNSPLYNKFKNFEHESSGASWDKFKEFKLENTALQEKFEKFSRDSNSAGWEGFSKRRRRKAVLLFWSIKFPMIIAMVMVIFYTNKSERNPQFEHKNYKNAEQISAHSTSQEDRSIASENNIQESESTNQMVDQLTGNSKLDQNKPVHSINGGAFSSVDSDMPENSRTITKNGGRDIEGHLGFDEDPSSRKLDGDDHSIKKTRTFDRFDLNINTSKMSLLELDFLETSEALNLDPQFSYPKESPWALTLQGGITYTIPKTQNKAGFEQKTNKDYTSIRNGAETPAIGYAFQLGVEYKYLTHLSFKTGIGLAKYRIGGNYNHTIDSVPFVDIDGTIYYLPPDSSDQEPVEASAGYQYTYLNIPIGISKTLPINDKWVGLMDVSGEVSFLMNASGNQVDDVYLDEFKKIDKQNLRKVNANLTLGLGLMRKINRDVSVGFVLNHKSFIAPVNSELNYSINNRSFGFSLLTKYNF